MKKKSLLSVLCIGFYSILFAQTNVSNLNSKWYLGVHGGYNTKMAASAGQDFLSVTFHYPIYTMDREGDIYKIKPFTYGQGVNVGLNIGYRFQKHLSVELAADYLIGSSTSFVADNLSYEDHNKASAKMIQLMPMMVVNTGGEGKVNAYGKIGFIVGLKGEVKNVAGSQSPSLKDEFTLIKKGNVAFGFTFGAGVDFQLNQQLSLFTELSFKGLTYVPKKGEVISFLRNGEDQLSTFPTSFVHSVYNKEADFLVAIDDSKPTVYPRSSYNFNSVGLNIGLKYNL